MSRQYRPSLSIPVCAYLLRSTFETSDNSPVKRRFLRQNRELAKTNSAQSVRIRCLEGELSRLLTENLELREQMINFKSEATNAPPRAVMRAWKTSFEEKLQALQGLLGDMDAFQSDAVKAQGKPSSTVNQAPRDWQKRFEVDQENMLPTIREGKSYPRRTLDAKEIQGVSGVNSDSPDIGPPPIAHYGEDPIKFDPTSRSAALEGMSYQSKDEPESESALLPLNLETRRKRKDSAGRLEIRRISSFPSPEVSNDNEMILPVRVGAKRKLSAREEDTPDANPTGIDFEFGRKPDTALTSASDRDEPSKRKTAEQVQLKSQNSRPKARLRKDVVERSATERKALGESKFPQERILFSADHFTCRKRKYRSHRFAEEVLKASRNRG